MSSTDVTSLHYPSDYVRILYDGTASTVLLTVFESGRAASVFVPRDKFLDAVDAALNVLVIDRDELPEVERDGPWVTVDGMYFGGNENPSDLRRDALARLAVAEYLEANPPVDEEQVAALTELIVAAYAEETLTESIDIDSIARRLVQAGVRVGGDDQ